jgi:hypothetical protein
MTSTIHLESAKMIPGIAEMARTTEGKAMLERHLAQVTNGSAFRGSHRSAQFLEYIVRQSAMGNGDQLKERVIGIELFGRVPSYDTGEDAIVRVTASDVRKRLVQHYSQLGGSSEFRIWLRPGKYVPELVPNTPASTEATAEAKNPGAVDRHEEPAAAVLDVPRAAALPEVSPAAATHDIPAWRRWLVPAIVLVLLVVNMLVAVANWPGRAAASSKSPAAMSAPWSALFNGSHPVLVIASDPNIEEIQRLTHRTLTLSDYANRHYIPPGATHLTPMQIDFMTNILRGNKIADFDGEIIAGLASLLPAGQRRLGVRAARATRIQDLESNENLVLLGSPRSNPWTEMYAPLLDFRFVFNEQTQREYIENMRPRTGELREYVPSAGGFDTGDSYATVSVVSNPGHSGRVLIIAGANGEGTEAAGDLVSDSTRWNAVLKPCHLPPGENAKQSLQLLLQLGTMAGSPDDVHVIACHLIAPSA